MQIDSQVLYLGRWVSREHFKAFVYNSGGQKLMNNYQEFSEAISSGVWFAEEKDVPKSGDKVVNMKGKKCQSQAQQ